MGNFVISENKEDNLIFENIGNGKEIDDAAKMFVKNITGDYMASGDLEAGRINENMEWTADMEKAFVEEYLHTSDTINYIAIKNEKMKLIGIAVLGVDYKNKYAILYDIIITRDERGKNYGTKTYKWLEQQLKQTGIKRIALESGIKNKKAHLFFKKLGFNELAVEFIKEIQ